jgi:hypothetical protein
MLPIQEPGVYMTMDAATFWEIKNEKIMKKVQRSYFPHSVPWGATCHCNSISCNPNWIFSWEIWKPSMTNIVKGSIMIYPKWKKDTVTNGTQILALNCWTLVWETSTDK